MSPSCRLIPTLPDECREALGDLGVGVGGSVLVGHRGTWHGMAETAHQLGQGRASLGGKDGAGVAKVVIDF